MSQAFFTACNSIIVVSQCQRCEYSFLHTRPWNQSLKALAQKILQLMKTPIGSLSTYDCLNGNKEKRFMNRQSFSGIETELAIIREITVFEKWVCKLIFSLRKMADD